MVCSVQYVILVFNFEYLKIRTIGLTGKFMNSCRSIISPMNIAQFELHFVHLADYLCGSDSSLGPEDGIS